MPLPLLPMLLDSEEKDQLLTARGSQLDANRAGKTCESAQGGK